MLTSETGLYSLFFIYSEMRVLCLFPRFYTGGVTKALSFVANSCASVGWDVYCISMTSEPETVLFHENIHRMVIDIRENSTGFKKIFWRLLFLLRLRRKILKIKPDVIIVFRGDLLKAILYASWGMKIPIIGSERGNPYSHGAKMKEYRNFFNRCNVVVFQTEMARDVYHISRKSVIIPNPVISRCGQMAFKTYRSGKNIVSAGRLSKEKNFIGLIRAFAQNQERLGNSKLIIYGDGPEYYNLQTLVKQLKVQNRVLLPGNVKDFTKQEDDGGIFVLNSLNEGMPNALLEAMGAGYACIASDCPIGAPAWLSDNGRRVRLIPVADDKALGDAMVDIYNNDSIALELRINAREILDILDPERIKQLWLSLIESVIDDRKY